MRSPDEMEALLAANPEADATAVRAGLKAIHELREAGRAQQPGYNILSPFTRRPLGTVATDGAPEMPMPRRARR